MASPARFTFDLNLAHRPTRRSEPPPPPSIPESVVAQLVADARAEGFAEGRSAGERDATSMAAQTVAAAAGTLAMQVSDMTRALDAALAAHRSDAAALALSVGRKLALHLIARQPAAELEALVGECLASLNGVPHLVIRCHPDLADAIRDMATSHMAHSGFSGRLVVMGDPDIRIGDGRLEWVDGGVVRDIAATAREIDQQIATYLAAHNCHADPEENA